MTFEEILDQAIAMLQRRGRVTYNTFKLQFKLDDEQFAVLKEELLYSQLHVVDDAGRGLIWTDDTDTILDLSPSPQPPVLAESQPGQPAQVTPPPAAPQNTDAERRQLTVMFCDLVDSTVLASHLDPEEYRDVVCAYQRVCSAVITRFDGHIAQLLGDGLLVYFGYPQAHEDDAQRAVRTGLSMLNAIDDLNMRLQQDKGIHLALRLGIHTGLVVVGQMGGGGRQEQLALGEVPNIASRIQGLAEPDTLLISADTYRLIQGYFACQALGEQTLRGVAEPVHVYRVLQESGARGRLDVAQPRGRTPLVGRESEVTLLLERWEQAKAGQGHVVLLTGDAGIGKSRLVQMLKEHVAHEPHMRWECRSAEYYQNTALFPLVDLFQRLLQFQAEDTSAQKLGKLEYALSQYRLPVEETVPLFAPLLSLSLPEHHYLSLNLSPQRQRQKTLETIVAILLELAEHQPVLFIVEDLHWTDPSTLELLNFVLDQTPTASLLVLLTCRPTFQPTWSHRSYLTEITVNRLSHAQVEQIVTDMTDGKTLPQEVRAHIIEKTDGVPLFVEEITKVILESGYLKDVDGQDALAGPLPSFAIPMTLHASLMARLDRLMSAKGVAQLGAVMGRQFSYEWLEAVLQLDPATLQRELRRLVEAELLYQRGLPPQATYTFKHALIQDAAYESLLKSTRQQYHQRIARVLEAQFPETAEAQPELLAHHYTAAACTEPAVGYWQRAGERALRQSAHPEAVRHLTTALELLATLPETPARAHQELALQTALGGALAALHGFGASAVERPYARARALCRQLGETPQLFPVLMGLRSFYTLRGELKTARELGEQLLHVAQHAREPGLLLEAHYALGVALLLAGAFATAGTHLEDGLALYDPQQPRRQAALSGLDPGVGCGSYLAFTLWYRGYPDQARRQSAATLTLAHELAHTFSQGVAFCHAAMLQHHYRDVAVVRTQTAAALALCQTHGFTQFLAMAQVIHAWAVAAQGRADAGLTQMHQGLAAVWSAGAEVIQPYFLALLAETYGQYGQPEAGLTALAEGLAMTRRFGEHWYEAELHRLHGALLIQAGERRAASERGASPAASGVPPDEEAEASLHRAWRIAHRQEAKSLELRAATSLARLWQQQGKRAAAYELLAPTYGWFTEGFDTADLQEAKALLDALA